MSNFQPNRMTFDEGLERIRSARSDAGFLDSNEILTSRQEPVRAATSKLAIDNIPDGFTKWQLPVFMDGPTQLFVSVGAPGMEVPGHSHDEGDGFRYIVGGSIIHDGIELTEGDWMFIPKGKRYNFKVGDRGVTMAYCYRCCCA